MKDGVLMAEDEEDCEKIYKIKGLVARSANFQCQSPIHNINSSTMFIPNLNTVNKKFSEIKILIDEVERTDNMSLKSKLKYLKKQYSYYEGLIDQVSIKNGTVVNIWATKCDGIEECGGGEDELKCGFNTGSSVLIGELHFSYFP